MKWEKVCIKDIALGIYDGPHATPPEADSGAIFLGISNFVNGQLDLSDIRYISENDYPKWTKRVTPQEKDIVFSYEATLNLYAIIPKGFRGCLGRRMALIRPDETKVNHKFMYYYFYSKAWREVVSENTVLGATVDRIPLIKFPNFQVELPPMNVQQRIADILSAYDDLIENNQKQIKLLEEAAQRLYKEWFVDLRFPGYENTPVVDGVPMGWENVAINDIAEYINGYAFKPSEWGEVGKPIIKIKEMGDGITKDTPRNTGADIPEKYHIYAGDILFSWSATLSAMIWDGEDGLLNQHLFKVVPSGYFCREYVLQSILYTLDEFQNLTTGATMKHIQRGKLKEVFVTAPNKTVMNMYDLCAEPIREKILVIKKQNLNLIESRDRLLPKLMSGELEV